MVPDCTNNNFNATSDNKCSEKPSPSNLATGESQSRINDLLDEIRSNHKEWNVGQIVSAFSEAGMLLIEHPPLESLDDRIDFDALLIGLNAAVYLIRGVLLQADMPSPSELMSVQRQFVCIIVLAAYAKQGDLLISTATALHKDVVDPFSDCNEYDEGEMFYHLPYVMVMKILTRFCLAIGLQELVKRKDEPPADDEVEEIVELASNVFVSSPSGTGTRWLRDYLQRHRGASWLTNEELTIDQEE